MKATKLVIKNIGKLEGETTIEINKPLILLYGDVKQGKSTVLNSVRWVFGGEFPEDIITHGQKDASIELHFDGGMIGRSFYRAKRGAEEGETKARPVVFVRNGKPVPSPVAEIKRMLNPFLLDQDFLRNKTELERKQYFTELFGVDTTAEDTELFNVQREATSLRSKIDGYGEIDTTPVETVDIEAAKKQLADRIAAHNQAVREANSRRDFAIQFNSRQDRAAAERANLEARIGELEAQLADLRQKLSNHPKTAAKMPLEDVPPPVDTSDLDAIIQNGMAQNVRAEQYRAALKRAEAKKADQDKLSALEKRGREIKAAKLAKLKTIGESCGIKGLEFDESGNFIYDGTTAGMISDSQIMRLSSELSALYPEGFGIDLLDRGESLGKSIFEFVDRAKAENKSILATIVGERPAKVPENVGVFVVENGEVKP